MMEMDKEDISTEGIPEFTFPLGILVVILIYLLSSWLLSPFDTGNLVEDPVDVINSQSREYGWDITISSGGPYQMDSIKVIVNNEGISRLSQELDQDGPYDHPPFKVDSIDGSSYFIFTPSRDNLTWGDGAFQLARFNSTDNLWSEGTDHQTFIDGSDEKYPFLDNVTLILLDRGDDGAYHRGDIIVIFKDSDEDGLDDIPRGSNLILLIDRKGIDEDGVGLD